jgi:hypothetical protein
MSQFTQLRNSLEMRSSIVYFFIISIFGVSLVYPFNNSIISIAICEIIGKFSSEYSRVFDIVEFGESHDELVTEIMKNINNSMAVTVHKRKYWKTLTNTIQSQSIYLFDNFQDLTDFDKMNSKDTPYLNPTRIIVYCTNASALEIATLKTDILIIPLYYFIVPDQSDGKIKLFTFDNSQLIMCKEILQLYKVNEFSITDQKWLEDPIFPKKFQNFYGCIMRLGFYNYTNLFFTSDETLIVSSFLLDLTTAVSKHLNFIPNMNECYKPLCQELNIQNIYNILVIETLEANSLQLMDNYRWIHSFMNVECR